MTPIVSSIDAHNAGLVIVVSYLAVLSFPWLAPKLRLITLSTSARRLRPALLYAGILALPFVLASSGLW